jgi:single-strand DNA-binding protein
VINKVILIGNLGREPEVRNTQAGSSVATLNVATAERVKDRDGNWQDHTEWHRCVCFGKTAENAQRFLKKGSKVFIEGRIRTNKWKDKDGQDRYTTEILVDNLRFLDSQEGGRSERDDDRGGRDNRSGGGGQRETQRERKPEPSNHGGFAGGDDDIPF